VTLLLSSVVVVALFFPEAGQAQSPADLNISLTLDFTSAERTLDVYAGRSGSPQDIAALPGSRLALAATAAISGQFVEPRDLETALEDARFGALQDGDVFSMSDAREKTPALQELLTEIRRRNFGRRVVSTVAQFFPSAARIHATVPVYFVAFGPQTIDAFVQRVSWRDGFPLFTADGELTIVLNLARAVEYGTTTQERFLGTLSTVAHEVFHVAFGAYQDSSDLWREFSSHQRGYLPQLLELTQNEGIAHYLSFEQRGGYAPRDWDVRVRASMEEFNRNAAELVSPATGTRRAGEIIRASNTSTYWESYGAITGLFIAREIDHAAGRPALVETVASGPFAFFAAYDRLCERDSNLPKLSPLLRRLVKP
jgi:hypothetical protein